MSESSVILQAIHHELSQQPSDVVGELSLTDDVLNVFSGKARITAVVHQEEGMHPALVHCHVFVELLNTESEPPVLDACIMGVSPERELALQDAASNWVGMASGVVFSLLNAKPVMGASHFAPTSDNDASIEASQSGVAGCHGFVGPVGLRVLPDDFDPSTIDGSPEYEQMFDQMFDYVDAMSPPGLAHLGKATLEAHGEAGWKRSLELDGHLAGHVDHVWRKQPEAPSQGIISRFVAFHFADQTDAVMQRQQVDQALYQFVLAFQETKNIAAAAEQLANNGVDEDLLDSIETFVPIAFGRMLLEGTGVEFPPEYHHISQSGELDSGRHFMRQPTYARAFQLVRDWLFEPAMAEAVKEIAMISSEVDAINQLLNRGSELENIRMVPTVIPEPGTSQEAVDAALEKLQQE